MGMLGGPGTKYNEIGDETVWERLKSLQWKVLSVNNVAQGNAEVRTAMADQRIYRRTQDRLRNVMDLREL